MATVTGGPSNEFNSGLTYSDLIAISPSESFFTSASGAAQTAAFISANSPTEPPACGVFTLPSAIDFTDESKVLAIAATGTVNAAPAPSNTPTGAMVVFGTEVAGTVHVKVYVIGGGQVAGVPANTYNRRSPCYINPTVSGAYREDAGFDPSNVTHVGIAHTAYQAFNLTAYRTYYEDAFGLADKFTLTGTGAVFSDFQSHFDTSWTNSNFVISPADAMQYVKFPYAIGDGAATTTYSASVTTYAYIKAHTDFGYYSNSPEAACYYPDNFLGHEVNASASDVITHSICVWLGTVPFKWHSLGSSAANVKYDTCVVQNAGDVQIADGHELKTFTFDSCGSVVAEAPTLQAVSINNSVDTRALVVSDTTNIVSVSIANASEGIVVDAPTSASMTLNAASFDNVTTELVFLGTGTLTVTQTGGTAVTTTSTPNGGTIVLQGAVVQQGLTFAGLQLGAQVIIYEAGTTNIIAIVESSGTTFEWIETYSVDRDVDYTITLEGFKIIRVTGVSLSDSVVPVAVQQVADRPYAPSTGLTFGVNLSVNTGTKRLDLTTVSTGQNAASALVEFWRAETALRNVQFPIADNGPDSFTLEEGWEWTPSSLPYLREDGWRYRDSNLNVTAVYANVSTNGVPAGVECEYQQVLGGTPSKAANTGDMDQLVQVFGDATHGDFDYRNYLVVKAQPNGYMEASVDVVALNGTLEDARYSIVLLPEEIPDFTTGDPGITGVTITDHGASPVTWNGKQFSVTITDTGGNTGEAIKRWLNYNKSLEAPFQSFEPFNLFDMVTGEYETMRGHIINSPGASQKGVRVVDGSGEPHPFFSRFQSDDGTYYVPPQSITFSAPNLTVGRVFLYNVTQAATMDNSLMTNGYNFGWVNGEDADEGDELLFVWASDLGDKDAIVKVLSAPGAGSISVIDAPVDDQVFNVYTQATGVGGADITEFITDFPNLQIDISAGDSFQIMRLYIFYKYILSSEEGIQLLVGAIRAIDSGNLLVDVNKVDFRLDSLVNQNVRQTDDVILSRSDGLPVPIDQPTGGYGISMKSGKAFVVSTSEGLSAEDKALMQAIANNQFTTAQLQTGLATYDVATVDDLSGIGGGGGGLDEAGMHTALDNYTNKDGYQADLSAVLSAIAALPDDTKAEIADAVLDRNLGGGSDGGRTVRDALRANRNRVTVDDQAGTITVYEEDDTTVAWSGTVTTSERDPISSVDPA